MCSMCILMYVSQLLPPVRGPCVRPPDSWVYMYVDVCCGPARCLLTADPSAVSVQVFLSSSLLPFFLSFCLLFLSSFLSVLSSFLPVFFSASFLSFALSAVRARPGGRVLRKMQSSAALLHLAGAPAGCWLCCAVLCCAAQSGTEGRRRTRGHAEDRRASLHLRLCCLR